MAGVVVLTILASTWGQRFQSQAQFHTQYELQSLAMHAKSARKESGAYPPQLAAAAGRVDRWGNPIRYMSDGSSFVLLSYGADGLPGGTGRDHDLIHAQLVPDAARLPARQLLSFWIICGLAGGLAFRMGWLYEPNPKFGSWGNRLQMAWDLGGTLVGASFVGWFLAIFCNTPSNH